MTDHERDGRPEGLDDVSHRILDDFAEATDAPPEIMGLLADVAKTIQDECAKAKARIRVKRLLRDGRGRGGR